MKSILVLLWTGLSPLLGMGQASLYSRTAVEQIPRQEWRDMVQGILGANQLILVTPDSLPEALQKMQQLVEGNGYRVAERTPTMLTTASKYVQDDVQRYILSRTWLFFHKRQPNPDPPVSFRLRVRAFRLPTGTQLQVVGYIQEGCEEGAKCRSEECVGRSMQARDFEARPTYHPSWYVAPRTPLRIWGENCFDEAYEVAQQYTPGRLYLGFVRRYATTGTNAW